jgi:tetratricopeptide (TPR) repeat protein
VRAREERKRRRLTLVLVATVLLAVLGAAAGALWLQAERTRQQTEAQRQAADLERQVTEDLNDLALHQERGEWAEARQAAERAGARLGSAGPEALRQRVAEARAELGRREARVQSDRSMRRTLEDLRLPPQREPGQPAAGWQDLDAAYQRAFAQYGLDLTTLSAEEAGRRVRDSAIGETLVAALDHWAFLCLESDRARLRQVLAVAQRADPDRRRQDLREAILREDKETMARLARDPRAAELPPTTLVLLGRALFKLRLEAEALRVLGDGQRRHPGDLWLTFELAYALSSLNPPRAADAEKFWRAALALRPDSLALHHNLARTLNRLGNRAEEEAIYRTVLLRHPDDPDSLFGLGNCLSHQGKFAEAEALLRRSLLLRPDDPIAWYNLGNVRLKQHKPVKAEAAYREALRLKDDYPEAHCNLGSALADQGKPAEAERECRTALRQNPDLAMGHFNLGNYHWRRGRRGEALDEYRAAVRLDPDYAEAHNNLGAALVAMGRFPEAEKVLRDAVRRKPDNPRAHSNLGNALAAQGKPAEAEGCYREAICLDPNFDQAHYNYGRLLNEQGRTAEAEASYRKAIRANPKYPEAHCNLGLLLATQGRFGEAIGFVRRGHELSAGVPGWRYPSAQWVKEIGEWAKVDARLAAILKGEEPPRDAERLAALARLCQVYKKRYADACRFYAAAFAVRPALADDPRAEHRYNAACVAALAAAGQGADAAVLEDKERARLRKQALSWLRADLDVWEKLVDGGKAADRQAAQGKMRHWQGDTDLSGVRHPWALLRLPAEERRQWQKLWADAAALRARCGGV